MSNTLAALALMSALAHPVGPTDTLPRLLQTRLDLDVQVDYGSGTVGGSATLTLRNDGISILEIVPLQVGRLMTVEAVSDGDGQPLSFRQDIVTFTDWPAFQVNQVVVELPGGLRPDDEMVVAIEYGGVLVGYTETGMRYVRDHVDREFTILRTDAFAFPTVGVPSLEGLRSLPRGDFDFSARITVPADLTVAAGVEPVSREIHGDEATWLFEGVRPVPFLNIAIAPYETIASESVRIFHFAADGDGARRLRDQVGLAMERYGAWFGVSMPDGRVTIIEIPEGWGSQASLAGGIIQTADAFRDTTEVSQLYHEIAHLWHPTETDLPPDRWNEGFATYLAMRLEAELDPRTDLKESMEALAARQVKRIGSPAVPMSAYGEHAQTDLSYGTGALMFYVLQRSLGQPALDAAVGRYISDYRDSGSTTEEFVDSMMGAGGATAKAVFDDWLFSTRWLDRLNAGEPLDDMIDAYRAGRPAEAPPSRNGTRLAPD
ncbi:MAG TPA: M1 family aminopeptidase [Gemmatimonadota bacterium]|nr:M1 family aminopeptidase [Gemmatimonadota bacterium]